MGLYDQYLNQSKAQYDQIVQGYKDREQGLGQNLESLGQNQLQQANQYYQQQGAQADQSAISRGLANTTVRNSLQQGVNAQRGYDIGQINNNIANQRLQFGQQWSGDTLGYMERGAQQNMGYGFQAAQLGQQYDLSQQQLAQQRYATDTQSRLGYANLAMQHTPPVTTNSTGGGSWGTPYSGPGAINYHPGYY